MSEDRKKIGLVLGGGGAKGVAHIGVLKVLAANDIPIDCIVGTSMGASIAALYALNKDPSEIERLFAEEFDWKVLLGLIDPSFQGGFIKGEKLESWMEELVKAATFADLKIPLSVVCTDINDGETVVINEGDVARAIRASISAPPTVKPIECCHDGRLLADGWISNPLPADVARKMGTDIVIGVVLDSSDSLEKLNEDTISVSIFLKRSFNILSDHLIRYKMKDADVVIRPKIGDLSIGGGVGEFLSKEAVARDIAAGEAAAQEAVDKIKSLL